MTRSLTLITTHFLDGDESETKHEEQHQFTEFVRARQPQLLDFQAYVSDDRRQLNLMFVLPDEAEGCRDADLPEPADRPFRDAGLAGVRAGAGLAVLAFAAAYLGSAGALAR